MPAIYSEQWYDALKNLINESKDVEKNAPRGKYDVLAEIRGDSRSLYLPPNDDRFFVILFEEGKCRSYRQVSPQPPRKGFNFIFELPASVFEGIAAGHIDLVDAGLKGAIKVTGDMRILIRHAEARERPVSNLCEGGRDALAQGQAGRDCNHLAAAGVVDDVTPAGMARRASSCNRTRQTFEST